jgi:hypothetical protein
MDVYECPSIVTKTRGKRPYVPTRSGVHSVEVLKRGFTN